MYLNIIELGTISQNNTFLFFGYGKSGDKLNICFSVKGNSVFDQIRLSSTGRHLKS